jgi:hypothetical protein
VEIKKVCIKRVMEIGAEGGMRNGGMERGRTSEKVDRFFKISFIALFQINDKEFVEIIYWQKEEKGMGPWHGPPFVTIWEEVYYLFDTSDGSIHLGHLHSFHIPK